MAEHTKTDGLPETMPASDAASAPQVLERSRPRNERMASSKIECNACPVLCQISPGKTGACDRYANAEGVLIRVDPPPSGDARYKSRRLELSWLAV